MDIKNLLNKLQDTGRLVTIERIPTNAQIADILQVAEQLGRRYTPLFTLDSENIKAYTNALKWLIADPTMQADHPSNQSQVQGDLSKGLLISGTTGTGKSLLLEILNALATVLTPKIKTYSTPAYHQPGGRTAGYQVVPLLWQTYRADTITDQYQSGTNLDKLKNIKVLAIQDIGTEPKEVLQMGTRTNVLKQILEHRADNKGLITLATTNLTIDQFGELYGERVRSRLFTLFNFIYLGGRDRRLF